MAATYHLLFELYPWFFFVGAFMIGSVMGSFLNVVIARVPLKLSVVSPASHCFSCKAPIKGIDNIPVLSYFILKGKCRHCQQSYSIRYAAIEFATGLVTAIVSSVVYFDTHAFLPSMGAAVIVWVIITLAGLSESRKNSEASDH